MAVPLERTAAPAAARRRPAVLSVRRKSPRRDRIEYLGLRAAVGALAALPLALAVRLGAALGWLAYWLDVPHRRIGMRNLAIAFPERSLRERRRILRASFQNLGRMAAEVAQLPALDAARIRTMVQFDEAWWDRKIAETADTGLLVLSGHFGNWELLVYAQGMRGYPVHMVHRTIRNPLVDGWFNAIRARAGTRLIRKHRAARDVLRALREHGLLVLPFDQNSTRGQGVFVDFFGLPASTNSGLARIALRSGVPVVPIFIVRQGGAARHVVHTLPPVEMERTGDFEEDVRRNTQRLSLAFEAMVRRYPEQWLWLHKRWKTRPPGEPRFY